MSGLRRHQASGDFVRRRLQRLYPGVRTDGLRKDVHDAGPEQRSRRQREVMDVSTVC